MLEYASKEIQNSTIFQSRTGMEKMRKVIVLIAIAMVLAQATFFAMPAAAQEVKRMTIEELEGMLGNSEVIIIDVRRDGDWKSSKVKIKGAVREDEEKADTWMAKYPKDKTLVFYCA